MPSKTRRTANEEDISVDEAPTSINPYTVLGIESSADASQIKTAYRKAALKCHPDKVSAEEKDAAHTQFQEVAFAYAILSDERRKSRYDTTGRTEESLDIDDDDFDWTDFFRNQYKDVVTLEKINEFADKYKGSEEEKRDVLSAFEKHGGDLRKLFNEVMLSDMLGDEERFRQIIDVAIASGEVEDEDKYSREPEKKRKARIASAKRKRDKEAKEAEAAQEEMEVSQTKGRTSKSKKKDASGEMDLAAIIQARQEARGVQSQNFFDGLEAKYGDKGKKRTSDDEPPEEAFAANRKLGKEGDAAAGATSSRSKRSRR